MRLTQRSAAAAPVRVAPESRHAHVRRASATAACVPSFRDLLSDMQRFLRRPSMRRTAVGAAVHTDHRRVCSHGNPGTNAVPPPSPAISRGCCCPTADVPPLMPPGESATERRHMASHRIEQSPGQTEGAIIRSDGRRALACAAKTSSPVRRPTARPNHAGTGFVGSFPRWTLALAREGSWEPAPERAPFILQRGKSGNRLQTHQEILPALFDADRGISQGFSRSDGRTGPHEGIEHDPFTKGERSIHDLAKKRLRLETRMIGDRPFFLRGAFTFDDILKRIPIGFPS